MSLKIEDYEEVLADHRRLVREIDAILSAPGEPAKQASLCDLIPVIQKLKTEAKVFREAFDHITMHMHPDDANQYVYMPYNEFFDHASVDDARYWEYP